MNNNLDRSIMDSMIYDVSHNRKKGIGYDSDDDDHKPSIENKPKSHFLTIIHRHIHKSSVTLENPKFLETMGKLILKDPKDSEYQKIK